MTTKLSPTQWRLYNFIKESTYENPTHWITHEEICEALPADFTMNHQACNKKCCSSIQSHVIKINENSAIEKIIMYKNQCYKLATTKEEAEEFIHDKLLLKGSRILKRYWQQLDKINKDGQGKLLSTQGNPIDEESKARDYVESFVNALLRNENK